MSEFGILPIEDVNLDDFFEDTEEPEKEEKTETITCPYCKKEFTKA